MTSWSVFANCTEDKIDFIKFVTSDLKATGTRRLFSMHVIFTDLIETWEATNDSLKMLFLCNHKEADTRSKRFICFPFVY